MFIVWDRLFGSFEDECEDEPVVFGVRKPLASWNPFWANLQVYDYLLFDARRTRRLKDKLGVWFRRTGWRPADVEAAFPRKRADLSRFTKYDPVVPAAAKRYALAQFGVATAATLAIGALFARSGASAVLLPCVLLWALLWTTGYVNEGRESAARLERLRLLVVNPLLLAAWVAFGAALPAYAWFAAGLYTLASLVALHGVERSGSSAPSPA